jgi:hypothetical protein
MTAEFSFKPNLRTVVVTVTNASDREVMQMIWNCVHLQDNGPRSELIYTGAVPAGGTATEFYPSIQEPGARDPTCKLVRADLMRKEIER